MTREEEILRRLSELENKVLGLEIAVNEIVFFAHDSAHFQRPFDKDLLAGRLLSTVVRLQKIYTNPFIREQITLPMLRMAVAMKEAKFLDKNGNVVDEQDGN